MTRLLSLFAAGFIFASAAPSMAAPQDTITDTQAYFTFNYCPQGVSDCGDSARINVKGKPYMAVGNTPTIQDQVDNLTGNFMRYQLSSTPKFSVTGYTKVKTNSSGWGPRQYTVFVITSSTMGTVPQPKGMPPKR